MIFCEWLQLILTKIIVSNKCFFNNMMTNVWKIKKRRHYLSILMLSVSFYFWRNYMTFSFDLIYQPGKFCFESGTIYIVKKYIPIFRWHEQFVETITIFTEENKNKEKKWHAPLVNQILPSSAMWIFPGLSFAPSSPP